MNAREILKLIDSSMCRVNALYGEWAKQNGISFNKMMTIYALNHNQDTGCTQKQICDEWLIPKQTINTIIKKLEKDGYIVFEKGINKSKIIWFTEAGREYAQTILKDLYTIEEKVIKKMGKEKVNMFLQSNFVYEKALKEVIENE